MVDHRNHDGLDNRRENLRPCTRKENQRNQKIQHGKASKFKGVFRDCPDKWTSLITVNGRKIRLGNFALEEDAAKAYDKAAQQHFGEFACLNFPPTIP